VSVDTQILKEHVASMGQRVDTGNDPGLPIESEALHAIFKNYDKIETKVETTEKGVVVVQTSTDAQTVAALQQHASEVTDFVNDGMAAMRTAMMKNGGGMMQHGMRGGTMRNVPNGDTAPHGRHALTRRLSLDIKATRPNATRTASETRKMLRFVRNPAAASGLAPTP